MVVNRIYELPGRKYCSIESEMSYFQAGHSEFCEHPDFWLGNTSWEIRVSEPNGTQHYTTASVPCAAIITPIHWQHFSILWISLCT